MPATPKHIQDCAILTENFLATKNIKVPHMVALELSAQIFKFKNLHHAQNSKNQETTKQEIPINCEILTTLENVLIASEDNGDMDDIDWNSIRKVVAKGKTTLTEQAEIQKISPELETETITDTEASRQIIEALEDGDWDLIARTYQAAINPDAKLVETTTGEIKLKN
jgi:hypothetical protein